MKNYLIVLLVFIISFFAFYFYIPTAKNLLCYSIAKCTADGASRQITNKAKWQHWWPGLKQNDSIYNYEGYHYKTGKIIINGFETTIFNDKDSIKGLFQFTSAGNDSTIFQWTSSYVFSANPLKRFQQYFQTQKIKKNVLLLLAGLKKYFDDEENIYGMRVKEEKFTQSSLISLKNTFSYYPSVNDISIMVQSLREYVKVAGGKEAGYPMLHVQNEGAAIYEAMVAIPTEKVLPSADKFQLKQMVIGGRVLVAEIKGGTYAIIKSEEELRRYADDHKKISPAISFQSLVTDRALQPDTSKWITKLYYPIF